MKTIIKLLITALVAYFLPRILSGVHVADFTSAIIFAIVLGLLNLIVKPILQLFSLPITIITLGLFSLVINALITLLAAHFTDGILLLCAACRERDAAGCLRAARQRRGQAAVAA
jgi:putative membrane protein